MVEYGKVFFFYLEGIFVAAKWSPKPSRLIEPN